MVEGLKLAIEFNISHLRIEMDAKIIVNAILKERNDNYLINLLLTECTALMQKIPRKTIRHVISTGKIN